MHIRTIHRTYFEPLINVLSKRSVMLFLMGARQVGKTTLAKTIAQRYNESLYLNWDIDEHRQHILSGQRFIESIFPLDQISTPPLVIFDEIHKHHNWKNFIKGFFDLYGKSYHVIVTGSSHLNIFYKGGDSLMGRYIPYTIHPFSLGEMNPNKLNPLYREPYQILEAIQ